MENSKDELSNRWITNAGLALPLLITGFGIGWLVGLSVSPVVSIVISSVVGSVAAIVGGLSGLIDQPRWRINPWPIALVILGMILGTIFGIQARTQDWLGKDIPNDIPNDISNDIQNEIAMWQETKLEMPPEEIAARLFERAYPKDSPQSRSVSPSAEPAQAEPPKESKTLLFGAALSGDECQSFKFLFGNELRRNLELASNNDKLPRLAAIITDNDDLEWVIQEVRCATDG